MPGPKTSPETEIHFFHIPKTAGSSVSLLIRSAYPAHECIPAHTIRELVALPPERVPRYRCYTGHFFSLLEPLVGRPLPTVTVLRDPFEQTISLIRHCQRIDWTGGLRIPLWCRVIDKAWQRVPRWRRWIEDRYCPIVMNSFQTRVLGSDVAHPGHLRRNWYGLTYPFLHAGFAAPDRDLDRLLERAKARLDSMSVVGTVERLDETVALIRGLLGLSGRCAVPRENVGGRRPAGSYRNKCAWDPDFLELVDRHNEHDRELHRHATELLEKRLTGSGVFSG